MKVADAICNIDRIAERARIRQAQSFRLSEEFLRSREREIGGFLSTWGTLTPNLTEQGEDCWTAFERGCFDGQLANRSITDESIRFVTNHDEHLDLGYWAVLRDELNGLYGVAVPTDSPATRELLFAIHSGRATHLSLHADVLRSELRARPGPHGWPVFSVTEATLREAGPCPHPKDSGAEILTVAGQEPEWLAQDRRSAVLWGLRPPPALVR